MLTEQTPLILSVCTGNVCRSPFMERMVRGIVEQAWGPGAVASASAGTGALVGAPMDPGSVAVLRAAGGDDSGFEARQLAKDHVAEAGLVLTAARAHRGPVVQLHPKALRYTFAVADFVDLADSIPDDRLPRTDDAGTWLREMVALVSARRGLVAQRDAAEADIVDPFRRDEARFREMASQLETLRPGLARALGAGRPTG